MTTVLCLTGCASTRKAQETTRTETVRTTADSLNSEVRLIRTETVPKSEVRLAIPADSLMRLPPRATYSRKSGRASVSVGREGDTVTVYASCDSLQALVVYYERRADHYRKAFEAADARYEAEVKRRSNPVRTYFYGLGTGAVLGVLTTIFIQKRKKNGK